MQNLVANALTPSELLTVKSFFKMADAKARHQSILSVF